jgi:hypothetical protein
MVQIVKVCAMSKKCTAGCDLNIVVTRKNFVNVLPGGTSNWEVRSTSSASSAKLYQTGDLDAYLFRTEYDNAASS